MAGSLKFHSPKLMVTRIQNATRKYPKEVDTFMKTSATNIQKTAKQLAPFKKGTLYRGIEVKKSSNGYIVTSSAPHSIYQEEGTIYIKGKHFMSRAIEREMPTIRKAPSVLLKKSGFI